VPGSQLPDIGGSVDPASTTVAGVVELATTAEVTAGTDTTRALTVAAATAVFEAKAHASATYAPLLVPVSTLTYNGDGSVATQVIGGVTTTYAYNGDGTVASETRAGVTRTYGYTAGNLTSVA
jgi:YD repeat-containing protein